MKGRGKKRVDRRGMRAGRTGEEEEWEKKKGGEEELQTVRGEKAERADGE